MLVAACGLIIATSCNKNEIEDLEKERDQAITDKDALSQTLNGVHGVLVPPHSLAGGDSIEFEDAEFWIWINESNVPTSLTAGYDIGPVSGTNLSKLPDEVEFTIMGLPIGTHYIYGHAHADLDTTGTPVEVEIIGGKTFEIVSNNTCPELHIHGELE